MTPEQDDELLMYVAAGIDPATALAAVSPADKTDGQPPNQHKSRGCAGVLLLLLVVLVFELLR